MELVLPNIFKVVRHGRLIDARSSFLGFFSNLGVCTHQITMAFNMKDILVYSRTAEITIDHTKSIEQALSTLRHIEIKEIVEVDPPKHRDWPQHEQLKIQRQALAYLSTLCCNSNPPISSSAMTYGQATKLDLPLLQTNHEDDLVRFKKGINTMKTKHTEQPRSIDHNKIDKRMDSLDRKAQARIRSDRRTDKDGFTISREALRYLQDVIESKEDHSLNGGAVYSKVCDIFCIRIVLI